VTSATAQARPESGDVFRKARRGFRNWRRSRPFWGGLLIFLAGFPIIYFAYAALNVSGLHIQLATTAGASAAVIGLLLIALGVSVWFQPLIRIFAGIAAIVLALISLPMANFGGFGLGLFPGLIGGALVCSWAPLKTPKAALVADGEEQRDPAAESPYEQFEGPEAKLTELLQPRTEGGDGTVAGSGAEAGPAAPAIPEQAVPEHAREVRDGE
jgi:hypothetical protein